ncbi:hypothetical protein CX676_18135 [Paracoccus zhejiangensis]|uniref:DUF2489 domain-containing protein n=2 Tax=Paracoccus zhejiangensis TaxID=1077935 RepID=A0A2H5F2R8_9RHOB|nr:hypothetical protein CX676_18135 [Paracoccus zhejiangensis]
MIAASAAVWGAWLATKAQAANRKLTQEVALAQFRQDWLNMLRSKLAEYLGLLTILYRTDGLEDDAHRMEMVKCAYEIQLLLSPHDPSDNELIVELRTMREAYERRDAEVDAAKVVALSQAILWRGWARITSDIRGP